MRTFVAAPAAPALSAAPTTGTVGAGWEGWRFALGAAAVTVALEAFAVFLLPALLGAHLWLGMGDSAATVQTAQYISNGGLGAMYSANTEILTLPGLPLLLVPSVVLGDHLGLVNGFPYFLARPTMELLTAPVLFVAGASSLLGVDFLAATVGVAGRRRRLVVALMGPLVVLPTVCWIGHPEDLLALGLSSVSLALVLRGRPAGAAVVLALAVVMQQWAVLLIPLVVVASPAGHRLRSAVLSSALPAVCGLTLLASDWTDAYRALVIQPMQGQGQHLPWWALTRVYRYAGVDMRVGSEPRYLAVITAIGVALAVRRRVTPDAVLLAAAVDLVARGIFETQVWPYYLAPGAVFLALVASRRRSSPGWLAGAGAATVFCACTATAYIKGAPRFDPALVLAVLVASVVVVVVPPWRDYRTSVAMADSTPLTKRPDSSVE